MVTLTTTKELPQNRIKTNIKKTYKGLTDTDSIADITPHVYKNQAHFFPEVNADVKLAFNLL
jgi:hypothetical protein